MSKHAGSLREVLFADVALVGSYASVCQHVLIIVANGSENLLADDAGSLLTAAMGVLSVAAQLFSAAELFTAIRALEPSSFVNPQVFVQPAPVTELLGAQMTRELSPLFATLPLVLPLVPLHVLHHLSAIPTDLLVVNMAPPYVLREVYLQLVATTTVLADVRGLVVAVDPDVVPLHGALALVLHMTSPALEEIIRLMNHFVLF